MKHLTIRAFKTVAVAGFYGACCKQHEFYV